MTCRKGNFKHGDNCVGKRTPEYRSWASMKNRCYNRKDLSYTHYGGRGIWVDPRWRASYVSFLKDMGRRPSLSHSLDRIDGTLSYTPGNCRWATKKEQAQNRIYKLTRKDVDEIRRLYKSTAKLTCQSLANRFHVDPSTISRIITGKRHPYATQ